jgi:glycosyltransferase involved in cell wall biosynthesis
LEKTAKIVCIIPTLNESATVAEVVNKAKKIADRIVVVDGHSEDGTSEIACKEGAEVILQDGEGKGMALRTVFNKIEEDICVILDGDATYDPLEMEQIIKPILEDEADMAVGSRLKGKMEEGAITRFNKVGNRFFNFLINSFFNGKITDSQSGYRALNRKAIESMNISSKGFEVETEMTIKALKQGLKVKEVPITYTKRKGTQTKLNSFKAGSRIMTMIIGSKLQRSKRKEYSETPKTTEENQSLQSNIV